jgi:hypothetical protein
LSTFRRTPTAGELADLLAALPRDMSVHLDPVEWAAGPAPWGVATIIARRIMLTERHPEPAGHAYPEGWEGWVPGIELQTVFLAEDLPDDHVPAKDEMRPAGTYDQAVDALDHNRLNDALRGVASVLNALSERIDNEVAGFIPRDRPSPHAALKTEIDAMTQLALRLVDLADPVEAAANDD